ncbi:hypothetical protein DTL42_07770 [Bremerella cremea]|uniref:Uncharacterized protein n=1 Tax=Bremerella cremea TaxID=1031537 RepID=A0A368KSW2_9BACT|nr:hypothetical protein [Bremerella cremea]RCS52726.1 hypothetical protein DTL42_07770 [Bremerella cremea]
MKNDFAKYAIPLLVFNCLCIDALLIAMAYAESPSEGPFYLNIAMGTIWGQYALCCAARLRFPEHPMLTKIGLVAIPLATLLAYPLVDPTEDLSIMLPLILMCFALTAIFCLAPATIAHWLYHKHGRQLRMKHMLVLTIVFAVASFGFSQLDFAGILLLFFTLVALPSIMACLMLSLPDQPMLYSVTMVVFLAIALLANQFDIYHRYVGDAHVILVSQTLCLWLGGQFLLAAGRGVPHELERVEMDAA